ncbi:Hypothetical protein SFHH103_03383 [Sinorhizobium fredii HH103]|uniref:Uncharacterized protein n=1 Tax=Sinorhizobium fredii (strain HH103) TaxID=1117943 RepID=G9A3C7_SINF1|nr:hypothetical protein [Sinorhizobium fredii]CCE97875.1 Hypothetical protein SFHH103_03383 [Sinorhizobium fredii HH103]
MQSLARNAPQGQPPVEFIEHISKTHPEDLLVLQAFNKHLQTTPLTAAYWGQVPYALGPSASTACRYRAVPQSGIETGAAGDRHDYLRERMASRLSPGSAPVIFDFQVQVRHDYGELKPLIFAFAKADPQLFSS